MSSSPASCKSATQVLHDCFRMACDQPTVCMHVYISLRYQGTRLHTRALQGLGALELDSVLSGKLCMQEHWFSLRKVTGQWWNFNSLLSAPQQLSQFYLSAYLATLRDQGYSIFVVHGSLPTYPETTVTSEQGTWCTEAEVLHSWAGK